MDDKTPGKSDRDGGLFGDGEDEDLLYGTLEYDDRARRRLALLMSASTSGRKKAAATLQKKLAGLRFRARTRLQISPGISKK